MYRLIEQYGIRCVWCQQIGEKLKRGEALTPAEDYHIHSDVPVLIRIRAGTPPSASSPIPTQGARPGPHPVPNIKKKKPAHEGELF